MTRDEILEAFADALGMAESYLAVIPARRKNNLERLERARRVYASLSSQAGEPSEDAMFAAIDDFERSREDWKILTCDAVRSAVREAYAIDFAPAPPDIPSLIATQICALNAIRDKFSNEDELGDFYGAIQEIAASLLQPPAPEPSEEEIRPSDFDLPFDRYRTAENKADMEVAWTFCGKSERTLLYSTEGHLAVLRAIQYGRSAGFKAAREKAAASLVASAEQMERSAKFIRDCYTSDGMERAQANEQETIAACLRAESGAIRAMEDE